MYRSKSCETALIQVTPPFGKRPTVSLSLLVNVWGHDNPSFLRV
jgi:hypothetical protein